MYHTLWMDWYLPAALPALERLFFSQVPQGSTVIDVCCGSGHVTKELIKRGYDVAGVDASRALIDIARRDLTGVEFHVQDVQRLRLDRRFDAALSTFDSLNHILTPEGLRQALCSVHGAVKAGGLFVFDMNLERAYYTDLRRWNVTVEDDSVGLVRGNYHPATKMAATELIWFKRTGNADEWTRYDSTVEQRCYPETEITLALTDAGFSHIEMMSGEEAGMSPELGFGRMFFRARA